MSNGRYPPARGGASGALAGGVSVLLLGPLGGTRRALVAYLVPADRRSGKFRGGRRMPQAAARAPARACASLRRGEPTAAVACR